MYLFSSGCVGALLFFLVFIILFPFIYFAQMIFKIRRQAKQMFGKKNYRSSHRQNDSSQNTTTHHTSSQQPQGKIYGPNDGEYIEFEELPKEE